MKDEEETPEEKSEGSDLKVVLNASEVVDLPSNCISNGIYRMTDFLSPFVRCFHIFLSKHQITKIYKYSKTND